MKPGSGELEESLNSLDLCRRYLCTLATFCAAASGDPDPAEVWAAARVLEADVPRTLRRLAAA